MKFLQPPIQVCRGAYIPYFKINTTIFCCPLFIKKHLNPQGRIREMVNEHTVEYNPSCSPSDSRPISRFSLFGACLW